MCLLHTQGVTCCLRISEQHALCIMQHGTATCMRTQSCLRDRAMDILLMARLQLLTGQKTDNTVQALSLLFSLPILQYLQASTAQILMTFKPLRLCSMPSPGELSQSVSASPKYLLCNTLYKCQHNLCSLCLAIQKCCCLHLYMYEVLTRIKACMPLFCHTAS